MCARALVVSMLLLAAACSDEGRRSPVVPPPPPPGDASTDAGVREDARADSGVELDAEPANDAEPAPMDAEPIMDAEPAIDAEPADTGMVVPFTLTSAAFSEGGAIPRRHACAGVDLQPALSWEGIPAGAQSLALVLIDDTINYVHWVAYNMPVATTSLPEGASDNGQLPQGTQEADAYCTQYCGPCPGNTHTYTFRIYALDTATINFPHTNPINGAELNQTFGPRSLGMATLTGTYTP